MVLQSALRSVASIALAITPLACSSHTGSGDDNGGAAAQSSGGASGSGGSGAVGGSVSSGCSSAVGGSGGMSGSAAQAGSGAGVAGSAGYACTAPVAPTCNTFSNYGSTFTDGAFGGTWYTFGDLTRDTDGSAFHVTGMVGQASGFGVVFNSCTALEQASFVSFMLSGMSTSTDGPNMVDFEIKTNSDELVDETRHTGTCVGRPGLDCQSPRIKYLAPTTRSLGIFWNVLSDGRPVASVNPAEGLGLEWQLEPDASGAPYAADFTIDDLEFTKVNTHIECVPDGGG